MRLSPKYKFFTFSRFSSSGFVSLKTLVTLVFSFLFYSPSVVQGQKDSIVLSTQAHYVLDTQFFIPELNGGRHIPGVLRANLEGHTLFLLYKLKNRFILDEINLQTGKRKKLKIKNKRINQEVIIPSTTF